jgi:hypothetical protein
MAALKGQPAPKPSQVASPVPGEDYAALAAKYAADAGNSPAKLPDSGGEDYAALAAQAGGAPQEAPATPQDPSLMQQAGSVALGTLDATGRVLDYPGGFMRAGLAESADMVQKAAQFKNPFDNPAVTMDDLANAGKGKGPGMAEYLKRMGLSDGGSVNVPVLGRVTLRGAEGLALDVATDPLSVITKASKELPYIKKLFNAPGAATDALGEAVYKAALPERAQEAGKAIIEGMPEAGIAGAPIGGAKTIAEHVDDVSNAIGKVRQGLYDKATSLGAAVDMTKTDLPATNKILSRMVRDPNLVPLAEEFQQFIDKYKSIQGVPLDVLSEWKTNLYNSLPASAWSNVPGQLKPLAKQFKQALASDFAKIIVDTGNAADKGLGTTIDQLNNKWGTLLEATRPLEKAAAATGGNKLGRMIDGAVLATAGIKGEVVKKAYEAATSPFAKTLIGKALMTAGRDGRLPNRMIIDAAAAMRPSPLKPPDEPTE